MLVLGFDCANKSLAYSYIEINRDLFLRGDYLSAIKILKCDVLDLFPGIKVSETNIVFRTKQLYKALNNIAIHQEQLHVVIESQPSMLNYKSSSVCDQLLMYYVNANISTINSHLKNKIYFAEHLKHEIFVTKALEKAAAKHKCDIKLLPKKTKLAAKYIANKEHTTENMKYLFKLLGQEAILNNISASNYDDLADSLMEIFAYVVKVDNK